MNCANHPDRERAAFCQNCGKPLCTECLRTVGSSTFCEPCLIARVAGAPAPGFAYAPGGAPYIPRDPGEPNPTVAAALGFIPGVGAMYNGQYAKAFIHLIVFVLLTSLANANDVDGIFVLFIFGWEFYMVMEAHHTARARRDGTPLPNPFGLNDVGERLGFGKEWPGPQPGAGQPGAAGPGSPDAAAGPPSNHAAPPYSYTYVPPVSSWAAPHYSAYVPPSSQWGAPQDPAAPGAPPYPDPAMLGRHRIPTGAIWLIGLGIFFLVGNTRYLHGLHGRFLTPLLLIAIGIWVFFRRMTATGQGIENDGTAFYRWRLNHAISSAMWLVLLGVIWLLQALHIYPFSRTWPVYMIAVGVTMFLRRTAYPFDPHRIRRP